MTRRQTSLFVAGASALILAVAYTSQYGFGLKPCILCLYQRVPYWIAIALGLAALRYPKLLALAPFVFLGGAVIAGFHVGVEHKWWAGLPSCGGQILPTGVSLEDLRAAINNQAIIRCDKPAWEMFGISMAGYNFLTTLALALFTGVKIWRVK